MKITLTAAQVEEIVRAHVAKETGLEVCHGEAQIYESGDYYPSQFTGYQFSFQKKETKYHLAVKLVESMPQQDKIAAIKAFRESTRNLTTEEKATFPDYGCTTTRLMGDTEAFGLAYSKWFVEKVWADMPAF